MTNGQPPPPKVTGLEADRDGPLCPGETVKFEAKTSPPSATVTWQMAVNGGQSQTVQGDGNTLKVTGASGETIVVTASLSNSVSKTRTWKVADLQIDVPPGPNNGRYVITAEPRMPVVTATAVFQGGSGAISEWEGSVNFRADDCPPNGPHDLKTIYPFSAATTDFPEGVIRGGVISFSAKGIVNGCAVSAAGGAGLVGTNPQQTDIQNYSGSNGRMHKALQRIACKESGQRQFDAPANGGTAYCPLFGPGGKVGIMQVEPTNDVIWNWKKNLDAGIKKFNESVAAAEDYPKQVVKSEVFKGLVSDFNKRRQQQQGLKPLDVVLRDFTKGNFDAPTDSGLKERELDAIRGYDDSKDKDRFGLKLHEYRVAIELDHGKEVLRVTNIDEETLRGEALWERVPVADRHTGRTNYVEEVLAFAFDCSARTVTCHLTGISPKTVTRFVGSKKKATFTAKGTGLDHVHWVALGGSPDSGDRATFTTDWGSTGNYTVTASCGGTTKQVAVSVVDVSIEIPDDIVQVKSDHPRDEVRVPCSINLIGPSKKHPLKADVKVTLKSPDKRLLFLVDFSQVLTLPANGKPEYFFISGEEVSKNIGDAKIQVEGPGVADGIVAEKNVTVFGFNQAQILVTQGGDYVLAGGNYGPQGGKTVSFSATARLIPDGLDCKAPQIANLRIGIVQERNNFVATMTWDTPTIKWKSKPKKGKSKTVTVSERRRVKLSVKPMVQPEHRDLAAAPLWDNTADALKPPAPCQNAGPATSFDVRSTGDPFFPPDMDVSADDGTPGGKVTWTKLVNTTLEQKFRTFCVVYNTSQTYLKFAGHSSGASLLVG